MTPGGPNLLASWQRRSFLIGVAASVVAVAGFFLNRDQLLRSYLFAYIFWSGVALGCLGILLLHNTVGGKWGLVIRRFCEAGARTLPYMAVLFVPIAAGMPVLYEWTHADAQDAVVQSKAAYLNVPFFLARAALYFLVWTLYAWRLSRWSAQQDQTAGEEPVARMRSISAPGLVAFVLTATFAFVDWVMSLEPHWYSTIYGAMFLVGHALTAFALAILLLARMSREPALEETLTPQHFHDLGNLMFAFMVLWAYLSFSQFLIIWSGDLPEEIPWYLRRLREGWGAIAVFLVIFHFAVPFLLLLQRNIKRRFDLLWKIAAFMLAVRLVDVYWVVQPAFYGERLLVHWMDFITPIAVGGLWLGMFFRELGRQALVPLHDPRLAGAPRETVAY
jgi:hypothetical protein